MSIIEIANIIKENGGTLYLVGGAVRDEIMNSCYEREVLVIF